MKRLISVLLVVALAVFSGFVTVMMWTADTALAEPHIFGQGYIISKNAAIREEARESSKKIYDARNGDVFDIIGEQPNWYQVWLEDGTTAWVHSWYMVMSPKIVYLCEGAPVYAAPELTDKRVGYVTAGDHYTVIAEDNNYYIINLRTASGYLPKGTNVMTNEDYKWYFSLSPEVGTVNYKTDVKILPDDEAKTIGQLNPGDEVVIYIYEYDYYAIEYEYDGEIIVGFVSMDDVDLNGEG